MDDLDPVVPAAVAGDHPALTTLIDPVHVVCAAHFAVVLSANLSDSAEALMLALMMIAQVLSNLCDLSFATLLLHLHRRTATVHNVLRALDKAVFVPLSAGASLPLLAAKVAELGLAYATIAPVSIVSPEVEMERRLRDVVAASLELDDAPTAEALLPFIVLRSLHQDVNGLVSRTRAGVDPILALAACVPSALGTFGIAPRIDGSRIDKSRALRLRAVGPVLRFKLHALLAEFTLEAMAQAMLDQVPRELGLAAAWWKQRLVGH